LPQLVSYADDGATLRAAGIADAASAVEVKDLGPQFSYRGVFIVEYAGPIAIVAAYAMRPAFLYGAGVAPVDVLGTLAGAGSAAGHGTAAWNAWVQALAIALWVAHFAKRELET
jgi:very-long-chain enoyl-CoA reductase